MHNASFNQLFAFVTAIKLISRKIVFKGWIIWYSYRKGTSFVL